MYKRQVKRFKKNKKLKLSEFIPEIVDVAYVITLFISCLLYTSKSLATKFTVIDGEIIPPFTVIAGLGKDPANNIIRERELKEFNSIEDFQKRTQVNSTVIAYLKSINFFKDMHETNQISLF